MPRANAGILVECDSSIKAIIMKIDAEHGHSLVIEDIDDEHLLVKKERHEDLKALLKDVRHPYEALKDAVKVAEEESESD